MTGVKIDGIEVAKSIKVKVAEIVNDLKSKGISPCLATVLVGDNPASATYVRNKHKACEEVGILTKDHTPPTDITQDELNRYNAEVKKYDAHIQAIMAKFQFDSAQSTKENDHEFQKEINSFFKR